LTQYSLKKINYHVEEKWKNRGKLFPYEAIMVWAVPFRIAPKFAEKTNLPQKRKDVDERRKPME
jgi:hypothetical protein